MFRKLTRYQSIRFSGLVLFLACGLVCFRFFSSENEAEKIPKRDRMDLAWQYEYDITRDPVTRTVPRERLLTALDYMRSLQQNANRMTGALVGFNWNERGPDNVSGRTRALLVSSLDASGETVFAAGVGGGLWKTTNISAASPTWTAVNDFFTNIAITTLAQDPSNGNIMYFGTGEGWANADAIRGDGIWKSTDGGNTFIQMAGTGSNSTYYYVHKIVVHPVTGDVYAATNSGLMRYTIATGLWTKVLGNAMGATLNQISDVEIAADNAVIAATGAAFAGADGIYRSPNGNAGTYTKLNNGANGFPTTGFSRIEFACAPSSAGVIYAMLQSTATNGLLNIYTTSDYGANWITCTKPVDADGGIGNDLTRGQAWYDMSMGVDPSNASTLIVGGIDLFRSTNSGSSWTQLSHWYGGFGFQEVHADQHSVVYKNSGKVYFTNDGGVFRSTNSGTTITYAGSSYNVTQYYACAINPGYGSHQFMAGAQDNGTQQYAVPGMNSTVEVTGGDGAFCHIDQLDPQLQFSSYVYNNIYRSTDGGASFSSIRNNNNGAFINPSDFDDVNKVLYGCYIDGMYTRLLNAGTSSSFSNISISQFNSGRVSAVTVSPTTANRVFFGINNGRVVRVDNANGATPTGTVINGVGTGFPITGTTNISCIAVENDDDSHLLVTVSNYGTTSIYETKNGGVNWTNCEGNLPDMPVRWALFGPGDSSIAIIATELGVWTTDELQAGATVWGPSNTGLANVRTDMLQMRTSDNMIIAATHGRGLFSSDYFSPAYPDFVADRTVVYTNKPVKFTDGSTKPVSWNWNFGDATSSNVQNPTKIYTTPGVYTVTLQINGNASLVKTRTAYITVLPDRGTPYSPATGGSFDLNPNDFAQLNSGGTVWQRGVSGIADKNGTRSGSFAWVTNLSSNYSDNAEAVLYTPNFSCAAPGTYTLKFYRKNRFETDYDGYRVEYSVDKGDNWTVLGVMAGSWYDFANAAGSAFPAGQPYFNDLFNSSFTLAQQDVSFLAGNNNVAFRFVFKSDESVNAPGVAIDDFELQGPNNTQLPVTLGSFTGKRKATDNVLDWNTFSEVDNRGFYIERSTNGIDFKSIGFVDGAGTSSILHTYQYIDKNCSGALTYYRLLQVDFNGDYAYSKTIALSGMNNQDSWVSLFPNPVSTTLNILFSELPEDAVTVTIYDASGALKFRKVMEPAGAVITLSLTESKFPQGVYLVAIESKGRRYSERILKY